MLLTPEEQEALGCKCIIDEDSIQYSVLCSYHVKQPPTEDQLNEPDPTVEWPKESPVSPWVEPEPNISEDRVWELVREYKFNLSEPVNEDRLVLTWIKYEYLRSWNDDGNGYVTKDGRSFVMYVRREIKTEFGALTMAFESCDPYWHEYSGYEAIRTALMPSVDGLTMTNNQYLVKKLSSEWMLFAQGMNEREDFYRHQVIDNYGPIITVNAPTAEQVQELIDNPDVEV